MGEETQVESSEPSLICRSALPATLQGDSNKMRRISRHLWAATLVHAEGAGLCLYIKGEGKGQGCTMEESNIKVVL